MNPGETTKTRDRAPGLDGVRALAVLTVIGFHEGASGLTGGFLGVDIFFVLSGFLITDLLIARYDRTGRLHLADFWTALLGLDHVHAPAAAASLAARRLRHPGAGSVAGGRRWWLGPLPWMTRQAPALPLPLVMPGALSLPNVYSG